MEMESMLRTFATLVLLALLAGCGGNDPGVVSCSSFDQTRPLVQVTGGDLQALCDCGASLGGGYGQSKSCDGGIVVKAPADRAACVARFGTIKSTCTATAGDSLNCATQVQQCNFTGTACQALAACYAADGGM
jgi:hypothetical protein